MAYITFQPNDYFNTKLYTGDGEPAGNAITGVGFQPDWVWIKERSSSNTHLLFDAVRGVTKSISSNLTSAEVTDAQYLTTFGTDGFTVGPSNDINEPSSTYASWNWKANGQGSSNTDGSINTTYTSASTTSGFSMIKYTGSGSAGTVGHGLGVAPDVTIRKKINTTDDWYVHTTLIDGSFDFLRLNTTASKADSSLTGFTSSTIGVDASSYEEIIYAFKSIKGFSKIGTYTGNGSTDGSFIFTGFKPAFVLFKESSHAGSNWTIQDNKREGFNPNNRRIFPNDSAAENTSSFRIDMLSNGFKLNNSDADSNGSGRTYIFMAFAEEPLVASNGIPATAR